MLELRLDVDPGYRVYYAHDGDALALLLSCGDKSTQQNDIDKAHRLADQWRADMRVPPNSVEKRRRADGEAFRSREGAISSVSLLTSGRLTAYIVC